MKAVFRKSNLIFALALVSYLAIVLMGFSTTVSLAAARDELLVAISSIGNTLDAAVANFTPTTIVTDHIYDRIIAFDENFEFVPAVARDWEYVDDVTFKFTVGEGFVFHNGEALQLEDVVFSIERLREIPRTVSFMNNVLSTEITGEQEITLTLVAPHSATIRSIVANAHVYNKSYYGEVGEAALVSRPIGTGPFKVERFVPGDRLVLERWEDYPFEKPHLAKITFKTLEEAASRYISLETGEAQFATISYHDLERAEKNRDLKVITEKTTNTAFISMNNTKAPFDNRNIRLAMAYATDRESLAIVQGGATPIDSMTPPMFTTYFASQNLPGFDLEKARALLEAEGYSAANPLRFEAWIYGGNATVMETYQAMLKAIGVDMSIKNLEFGVFLEGMANREYQMLAGSWNNTSGNPLSALENYWTGSFGASNISFFENARADELYDLAKGTTDEEILKAAAQEVQEIAAAEMPIIPTFSNLGIFAMDKNLLNVRIYPSAIYSFRNAYFE